VKEREAEDCRDEITGCVRFIASLSCVDGLVLATPDLTIRGFGVEIRTKKEVEAAYLAASANSPWCKSGFVGGKFWGIHRVCS
jgi:hypothetical protein